MRRASKLSYFNLAVMALGLMAVTCLPACNRGPDISTPKKAAVAFMTAVKAGDMETMKKSSAGTDAQYASLQKMSDMMQAGDHYHKSIVAKFGEQAKKNDMMDMSQAMPSLDDADEKIDGDKATVTPKSKNALGVDQGIKLKKDSDGWKIDLAEIDKSGGEMDKMSKPMVDALNATAKEVDDGKFKTADEATMALGQRIMSAPH